MAQKNLLLQVLITAKDQTSSVLAGIGGALASLGGTILDVARSAVNFEFPTLRASTDDAERLERQMGALRVAIDATGGAAGLTAEDIDAMARNLDEATLGSAEGFRNAALQLLTFKSVGVDAFERTLKAAQDLSAAGFGTVESATVQLGKALENPVQGLTALTRVGVSFTAEQEKMIDSFIRLGDVAGAQNVILAAVEGQVQGVAAAAGGGLSGAIDLVGKRMTDLRETIGGVLLPILTQMNLVWADVIGAVQKTAVELAGPIKSGTEQAGGALRALGEGIKTFLIDSLRDLAEWIKGLDWTAIQTGATQVGEKLTNLGQSFREMGSIAGGVIDTIKLGVNGVQIAFNTVVGAVQDLISKSFLAFAAIEEQAAKIGLGTLERANELRARAEDWKSYAAESIAAIQRDAGEAGAAFDSLVSRTDAAAAAQQRLGKSLPAAELQELNKTLADYQTLADRANNTTDQAKRDYDAGKISVAEYGAKLIEAAAAAQNLARAQDAEATRQAAAATKEQTAALVAQISQLEAAAAENEKLTKVQDAARAASLRQLQAELELARARGDTVKVITLTAQLTAQEIEDAQALASAKRAEADNLQEQIAKRRELAAVQGGNNAETRAEIALLQEKLTVAQAEAGAAQASAQALAAKAAANQQNRDSQNQATQATQQNTQATNDNSAAQQVNIKHTKDSGQAATALAGYLNQARTSVDGLSESTRALFDLELSSALYQVGIDSYKSKTAAIRAYKDGVDAGKSAIAKLTRELKFADELIKQSSEKLLLASNGYRKWEAAIELATGKAKKAFYEQALAAENAAQALEGAFSGSARALESAVNQGARLAQGLNLLDEEDLSRLRGAIADANERLREMQEETQSARDRLAELNAEIAEERGESEKAALLRQQLDYQQALADLEAKRNQAQLEGNRDLIALYDEQARKLAELNALKETNIRRDEESRKAQSANQANTTAPVGGTGTTASPTGTGAARTYNLNLMGVNGRTLPATTTADPASFLDELERARLRG